MVKKILFRSFLFLVIASVFCLAGCSDKQKHVDTTGNEVVIQIKRLEKDLFDVQNAEMYKALDGIDSLFIAQYKTQIVVDITGEGRIAEEESGAAYVQFVNHPDMQHLYKSVMSAYPTMEKEEVALSDAFSIFHTLFAKRVVPRVYTFISPFNAAQATSSETLGIGLDMYLGEDFGPYASPDLRDKFPKYKVTRCRRDYIVPNSVKAWLLKEFEIDNTDRRLLNQMIYEGKILYAMDVLLPDVPDSLKIGYHRGQTEWCVKNEFAIWNHIIQNDLLYSNEYQKFAGILTDGPFSKGLNVPNESPPMIALWAGWQIVRKYMKKHPEVTVEALMLDADADKILKASGYKP